MITIKVYRIDGIGYYSGLAFSDRWNLVTLFRDFDLNVNAMTFARFRRAVRGLGFKLHAVRQPAYLPPMTDAESEATGLVEDQSGWLYASTE